MSFLGSFLALRCTSRARASTGSARRGWLLVAAISLGITGIWVMHFIAMLGFSVPDDTIRYNVLVTLASMLLAVAFVSFGLMIVGFGPGTNWALVLAGVVTGCGVAGMHYTGMAAMHVRAASADSMGMGGASASSFLLPLIIGVSVLTFVLTATIALSPTDEEIHADAELMRRIESVRAQAPDATIMSTATVTPAKRERRWRPPTPPE